jgi:hypothetical protein
LISPEGRSAWAVLRLVLLILGLIGVGLLFSLVQKLTFDFVVPIMYLRTPSSLQGWRQFLNLLSLNKARFLLYILFSIVLAIVIGFMVMALVLVTCCCAGCLLSIPYLGTVFFLPVLTFSRSYALYYLAQYGREFDVFSPPEPAAVQI